ncbi:MAG TPA: hypothetical protein VE569_04925 [Acidimicrobiia bacterium]|jgi:penicillin amidase|nr:hypothetical protein [Acidimicrobiia bacterium]
MRWVKRVGIFVLVLLLRAGAFGVYTVRRSFPQVNGELEVQGLNSDVEVLRDGLGVPHIYTTDRRWKMSPPTWERMMPAG